MRDAFERIRRSLAAKPSRTRASTASRCSRWRRRGRADCRGDARRSLRCAGGGGPRRHVGRDVEGHRARESRRLAGAKRARCSGVARRGDAARRARRAESTSTRSPALLAKLSEFAAAHAEIAEMDLNPVVAYPRGLAIARRAHPARSAMPRTRADADPHHAQRIENLKRAFNAATVAVDRRQADGRLHVAARDEAVHAASSTRCKSIPTKFPGIEAMGVDELQEPGRDPRADRLRHQRGAAPDRAAHPEGLCRQPGRPIGFFTSGFSETGEELGIKLERELRATARRIGHRAGRSQLHGAVQSVDRVVQLSRSARRRRPATSASSRKAAPTPSTSACRRRSAGIHVNKAASIGNVLMLEAADYIDLMADDPATRAIGMYIEGVRDGRRFFESLQARRRAPSGGGMEGRNDRGRRARDVLAYRIARDRRPRSGARLVRAERGGRGREPRRDARRDRTAGARTPASGAAGWVWSR